MIQHLMLGNVFAILETSWGIITKIDIANFIVNVKMLLHTLKDCMSCRCETSLNFPTGNFITLWDIWMTLT